MTLINIQAICDYAERNGFRVRRYRTDIGGGAELFSPEHTGPEAVWSGDSCYSTADYIVTDSPKIGYGFNGFFHGPWHTGYAQSDEVAGLLRHPAMRGFAP